MNNEQLNPHVHLDVLESGEFRDILSSFGIHHELTCYTSEFEHGEMWDVFESFLNHCDSQELNGFKSFSERKEEMYPLTSNENVKAGTDSRIFSNEEMSELLSGLDDLKVEVETPDFELDCWPDQFLNSHEEEVLSPTFLQDIKVDLVDCPHPLTEEEEFSRSHQLPNTIEDTSPPLPSLQVSANVNHETSLSHGTESKRGYCPKDQRFIRFATETLSTSSKLPESGRRSPSPPILTREVPPPIIYTVLEPTPRRTYRYKKRLNDISGMQPELVTKKRKVRNCS